MKSLRDKFKWAFKGLFSFFADTSVLLQLVLAVIALSLGLFFHFNIMEWSILLLCCGLVVLAEMVNSCLEKILDFIHPKQHQEIGAIKDKGAGFVLFASFIALVVGVLLFGSKLW